MLGNEGKLPGEITLFSKWAEASAGMLETMVRKMEKIETSKIVGDFENGARMVMYGCTYLYL